MERMIKALYGWLRLQMPWNANEKKLYAAFMAMERKKQQEDKEK